MSEEVTVVEASKCPRCSQQGVARRAERVLSDGIWWTVTSYHCVNEDCRWFNTGWAVQHDERGVVYQRPQGERGQDKTFHKLTPGALARGRAMIEEVAGYDVEEVDNPGTPEA